MKIRLAGVALAGGLWMSGLCFADETSVRAHLMEAEPTAYLQNDASRIERIEPGKRVPADSIVFQKFIDDIPLHGGRVIVIENADGTVARVFDDSSEDLELRPGGLAIAANAAVATAEAATPNAIDSDVELVWFRVGDEAVLAWEVTTSLRDPGLPVSPTHLETVIHADTGAVLSQRQIDTKVYVPGTPETADGVFPRIVINDAIGEAGSRSYAAPFDAVVEVGFGCSGTLIAADVVLCARHCGVGAGDVIVFGDDANGGGIFTANVQSSLLPDGGGSLLDGGDVSILTLTSSVPQNIAVPMRLIDETDGLEGMLCATLGYGFNGLGSVGHQFSGDGFRWGGENIIDVYGSPADSSGTNIISTDFDDGSGGANTIPGGSPVPVEFEATTAPGDSGGPVLVQFGGEWVIAGVLSGGTTFNSVYGDISWWTGTAIFRSAIEASGGEFVSNDVEILLPDGLPSIVSPAGGDTLRIDVVSSGADAIIPGSGTFHVDTGSGFQQLPLAEDSENSFVATFPASECPTSVDFFISFDLQSGNVLTSPAGAPAQAFSVLSADGLADVQILAESFESGLPVGWGTSGLWNVTDQCDPTGTCDGVGFAYYGTPGSCDFDAGTNQGELTTTVTLPAVVSGGSITLRYCSALETEQFSGFDVAQFSAGSGAVIDVPAETSSWQERTVDLTSLAGQTIDLTWSFDTVDDINNDFRGWHVDNVRIDVMDAECNDEPCPGDANDDNVVDVNDLNVVLSNFGGSGPGDVNGDGIVDVNDLNLVLSGFGLEC